MIQQCALFLMLLNSLQNPVLQGSRRRLPGRRGRSEQGGNVLESCSLRDGGRISFCQPALQFGQVRTVESADGVQSREFSQTFRVHKSVLILWPEIPDAGNN